MGGVELPLHPKEHSFHNILGLTIIQLAFQSLLALSTLHLFCWFLGLVGLLAARRRLTLVKRSDLFLLLKWD